MASFDFSTLVQPLSDSEPCGPDLDGAGDPDFSNFLARAEGVLPASYYTRDSQGNLQPFDRGSIDFTAEFKTLDKLLAETRDIRLLAIYGKLLALNRDLQGFAACMRGVAALLQERWDDVHPRGDGGDFTLRAAVLQAFDEMPTIVLPLQNITLAESRRTGPVSMRTMMVANGEMPARADETKVELADAARAFEEADLAALKVVGERFRAIRDATDAIQAATVEKAGYDQAVSFERLPPLLAKVLAVVEPILATRDPDAAPPPAAEAAEPDSAEAAADGPAPLAAAAIPAGRIATMADAGQALAAVSRYFALLEPSNPAALLVRQAETLIGKSFMDVMRILVPNRAEETRLHVGPDQVLQLSIPVMSMGFEDGGETAAATLPDDGGPPIDAATRGESAALLQQVGAFYRRAEPSSPIPLLTDRARNLMERDFLSLLNDVLPSNQK